MLFFIASGLGLVLYLNMENPQVRERGYFFLGSYQIIMVWVGMGVFGIISDVREWLVSKNLTKAALPATLGLFAVFGTLPPAAALSNHIDPKFNNYEVHDRSDDWAPWDYAHNILVSCEPNAILFTNGDNDTFPLWYLQEVKGFRKDVRVVNLSLLNTDWYILQLRNEGVTIPIQYDENYIRNNLAAKTEEAFLRRVWPVEGKEVDAAGIKWNLTTPQKIRGQDGDVGILRIQDIMVYNIINWVNWQRPLYFAVTVARENMAGLDEYLSMEGMVYRISQTKARPGEMMVNVPVLDNNVFNRYQYRGLTDPGNYIPPNTKHLTTNYFIGFAQLAERYANLGDKTNALRAAQGAIEKTPSDLPKRTLLYQVLVNGKMYDEAQEYIAKEMKNPEWAKSGLAERLSVFALLERAGDREQAYSLVQAEQDKSETDTSNTEVWQQYIVNLYSLGDFQGTLAALDKVLEISPNDQTLKDTRNAILQQLQAGTGGDSSAQGANPR
jgi:tetratricopeptide (TPR) repeat protein